MLNNDCIYRAIQLNETASSRFIIHISQQKKKEERKESTYKKWRKTSAPIAQIVRGLFLTQMMPLIGLCFATIRSGGAKTSGSEKEKKK